MMAETREIQFQDRFPMARYYHLTTSNYLHTNDFNAEMRNGKISNSHFFLVSMQLFRACVRKVTGFVSRE